MESRFCISGDLQYISLNEMEQKEVVFWMTAQQSFQEKGEITFIYTKYS